MWLWKYYNDNLLLHLPAQHVGTHWLCKNTSMEVKFWHFWKGNFIGKSFNDKRNVRGPWVLMTTVTGALVCTSMIKLLCSSMIIRSLFPHHKTEYGTNLWQSTVITPHIERWEYRICYKILQSWFPSFLITSWFVLVTCDMFSR